MSSLSSQKRKEKQTAGISRGKNFVGIKVQTSNSRKKVFLYWPSIFKGHARSDHASHSLFQDSPEIFPTSHVTQTLQPARNGAQATSKELTVNKVLRLSHHRPIPSYWIRSSKCMKHWQRASTAHKFFVKDAIGPQRCTLGLHGNLKVQHLPVYAAMNRKTQQKK